MEPTDIFLAIVYVTYVVAAAFRDEVRLRAGLTLSGVGFVVWGFALDNWVVVAFNTAFALVSAAQVIRLVRERRHVELDEQQEAVRDALFPGLSNRQFLIFWHVGVDEDLDGEIITEGNRVDGLSVLLAGEAEVRRAGDRIATLGPHSFIGEMSFLGQRHQDATASVHAVETVLVRTWDQEKLTALSAADPVMHHALLEGMAGDLVAKLSA